MSRQNLEYRFGYWKAVTDIAGWINKPNAPLPRALCNPRRIESILGFIADNIDQFMECPDLFELNYEVEKKKMRLWLDEPKGGTSWSE